MIWHPKIAITGWKLNESQTGERQSAVIQRQMAAMLHITLENGVSDRTCGTKNWLRFTILAAILRFHNLGYGFLNKWSCTGSLVWDN